MENQCEMFFTKLALESQHDVLFISSISLLGYLDSSEHGSYATCGSIHIQLVGYPAEQMQRLRISPWNKLSMTVIWLWLGGLGLGTEHLPHSKSS